MKIPSRKADESALLEDVNGNRPETPLTSGQSAKATTAAPP
jgi:hypothetical protein